MFKINVKWEIQSKFSTIRNSELAEKSGDFL